MTSIATFLFLLPALAFAEPTLTVVYPAEGEKLPSISQIFVYGAVTPGSTLTVNGSTIPVHSQGGYLTMLPVTAGNVLVSCEAKTPSGETAKLDRHFSVAEGFKPSPITPLTLVKDSLDPKGDMILSPGDTVRVFFQGSPRATAEFSIRGVCRHIPMADRGWNSLSGSSNTLQGLYEGSYRIQSMDQAEKIPIEILLKSGREWIKEKTKGRLTINPGTVPRVGTILEDTVAVRTGPEGGYDLFLYKGMRVHLTAKVGNYWRIRLSSLQSGWIKENVVKELPRGLHTPRSILGNFSVSYDGENSQIRIPLQELLPYRVEQDVDHPQLRLTLYGAVNHTERIRYDAKDPLVKGVRWRQLAPDTCQIVVDPAFERWWGYDVRYEGTTLVIEVRKPWAGSDIRGMIIALDPGHGGSERGAVGPHGTLEKDANLAIARVVEEVLLEAGAKPFLTRESDMAVPLYERSRIAFKNRAHLFISIHCNSTAPGGNPLASNGYSVYWYHPQSGQLAQAIHAQYGKKTTLPDHGLYYGDLAVCRMTQMPAVLTEQAFMIIPEQEILILSPAFQKSCARAILGGIRQFLASPAP